MAKRRKQEPVRNVYPVRLPFALLSRGRKLSGITEAISSKAILLPCDIPLFPDEEVLISVDWPLRLDGKVPLSLFVTGKVLWIRGGKASVMVMKHVFRTRRTEEPKVAAAALAHCA